MPTAQQIINRTYRLMVSDEQPPSQTESTQGLAVLNTLLDSLQTDKALIFATKTENFPLVAGTASYTVGIGGNFNTYMPLAITAMYVRYTAGIPVDYPVRMINSMDYANYQLKSFVIGIPGFCFYNPNYPLGTINLLGAPDQAYQLYFDSTQALQQFADLTTNYTLAPGYERFLNYALLKDWCSEFSQEMTPSQIDAYKESKALIKNKNIVTPTMKTEVGLMGNQNNSYLNFISGL